MRILIADKFEAWGIDQLRKGGDEVIAEPGLKGDVFVLRMREVDPEVLIVRSSKVPAQVLEAGRNLKLVIRAGAGVDNIDIRAASKLGINVSNCPGQNACAVAELVIGLMVALDRKIPDNVIDFRNRKWNKKEYSARALGFKGRTMGVVGAGRIGGEVIQRVLAFDMHVLYFNLGRTLRFAGFPNCTRVELDELMRQSDVISIHVPGGDSTHNLIDERRIGLMKPSALFLNTSRAGVVDQPALIRAVRDKRIRGAALDVFDNEPPADGTSVDSPLCEVPGIYVTHHIGASTEQAQLAVAEETVRIVAQYKVSGKALNCVNLQTTPDTRCLLVVRLVNKPGGLAHVLNHIAQADINVEEMDHVIYDGGKAACAQIRLDQHPSREVIDRIAGGHPNVMGLEVIEVE